MVGVFCWSGLYRETWKNLECLNLPIGMIKDHYEIDVSIPSCGRLAIGATVISCWNHSVDEELLIPSRMWIFKGSAIELSSKLGAICSTQTQMGSKSRPKNRIPEQNWTLRWNCLANNYNPGSVLCIARHPVSEIWSMKQIVTFACVRTETATVNTWTITLVEVRYDPSLFTVPGCGNMPMYTHNSHRQKEVAILEQKLLSQTINFHVFSKLSQLYDRREPYQYAWNGHHDVYLDRKPSCFSWSLRVGRSSGHFVATKIPTDCCIAVIRY